MRQFFINHLINNEFVIDHNGDCHHAKVVRLKVGEQIVVVYRQQRYQAVIEGINLDQQKNITKIWGKVVQPLNNYEHDYQLTVFFALNQQKSWEFLVPKLTELGVSCLTPIICAFDQPSHWLTNQQWTRWQMMVKVAAEQSNRNNLLKIVTKPILFSSLISQLPEFDHVFFGDELLVDQANYHSPKIGIKKGSKIGLIIGPAGGFSLTEHQQLKKRGVGIKLANTILKSETAAISLVNYCYFLKQHYG